MQHFICKFHYLFQKSTTTKLLYGVAIPQRAHTHAHPGDLYPSGTVHLHPAPAASIAPAAIERHRRRRRFGLVPIAFATGEHHRRRRQFGHTSIAFAAPERHRRRRCIRSASIALAAIERHRRRWRGNAPIAIIRDVRTHKRWRCQRYRAQHTRSQRVTGHRCRWPHQPIVLPTASIAIHTSTPEHTLLTATAACATSIAIWASATSTANRLSSTTAGHSVALSAANGASVRSTASSTVESWFLVAIQQATDQPVGLVRAQLCHSGASTCSASASSATSGSRHQCHHPRQSSTGLQYHCLLHLPGLHVRQAITKNRHHHHKTGHGGQRKCSRHG